MATEISTTLATLAYDSVWTAGGFSLLLGDDGTPVVPTHGFVVGTTTDQPGVKLEDPFAAFLAALDHVMATYPASGVGGWVHDDHVHIDPIEIYADRGDALSVAQVYEQSAIYDVEHEIAISVETGEEL